MITRIALLLAVVLLAGTSAFAQLEGPGGEIGLNYSYIRAHANKSLVQPINLNGGGGSIAYYFNGWIGIKGDIQGYGSTTQHYATSVGNVAVSGNLLTYMAGPIIDAHWERFTPFGELLFGGAHTNAYGNLTRQLGVVGASRDNNGFAMAVGGGVDLHFGRVGLRLGEFDYLLTRLGNNIVGTNNQSSFRFQTGVLFDF